MGGDGHTASFFPDADDLARLLDPASTAIVLPVHAASAGEPRLTLSLARHHRCRASSRCTSKARDKRRRFDGAMRPGARNADPRRPRGRAQTGRGFLGALTADVPRRSACTRRCERRSGTSPERTRDRHDRQTRHRSHHRAHPRTLEAEPRDLSRPHRRGVRAARANRGVLSCGNLAHGFAVCCPSEKAGARRRPRAQSRHHHLLQRHAVGASAVRDLSGADQGGGARGRRHRAGGRRRAGDVRRRHPGPARHGAVAVFARRDRHGGGGRPVAQHVRRRRLSRRLRQDRAGPGDRGADLRPSAGGVHSGRADDDRACPTTRRPGSASSMPRARSAAPNCWRPNRNPITGRAPAPSTAPPTPTRC